MRIYKFILIFLLYTNNSFAFNPEKCKENFKKSRLPYDDGPNLFTTATTNSTTYISDITTIPSALSEYVSTFGNCDRTLPSEDEKLSYLAQNFNPLKIEMSKGEGEYLNAFIELFDCKNKTDITLAFKKRYVEIFPEIEDLDRTFEKIKTIAWLESSNCRNNPEPDFSSKKQKVVSD